MLSESETDDTERLSASSGGSGTLRDNDFSFAQFKTRSSNLLIEEDSTGNSADSFQAVLLRSQEELPRSDSTDKIENFREEFLTKDSASSESFDSEEGGSSETDSAEFVNNISPLCDVEMYLEQDDVSETSERPENEKAESVNTSENNYGKYFVVFYRT